jgi:flavin-dependent dehydrogenase
MAVDNANVTRLAKKAAGAAVDYNVGFTLDSSDTLSSSVVSTITSGHGITVASTGASNVVISAASGQTSGELYYFALEVQTSSNRKHIRQFLLPIGPQ